MYWHPTTSPRFKHLHKRATANMLANQPGWQLSKATSSKCRIEHRLTIAQFVSDFYGGRLKVAL
jgi:hypothetical protein